MTDTPDDQPVTLTIDGEEFASKLADLVTAITELTAYVAGMDQRLTALEQRGKRKRKGFVP